MKELIKILNGWTISLRRKKPIELYVIHHSEYRISWHIERGFNLIGESQPPPSYCSSLTNAKKELRILFNEDKKENNNPVWVSDTRFKSEAGDFFIIKLTIETI